MQFPITIFYRVQKLLLSQSPMQQLSTSDAEYKLTEEGQATMTAGAPEVQLINILPITKPEAEEKLGKYSCGTRTNNNRHRVDPSHDRN